MQDIPRHSQCYENSLLPMDLIKGSVWNSQKTPEEGSKVQWLKHCEYKNKNESNSLKGESDVNNRIHLFQYV